MERMKRKHRVKCSDEIISKQSKSLELLCAKRPFAQQNGNNTLIRPSMSTNYTVLHWNFSSTKNFTLKHNYEFEKCSLINCIETFFCMWFFLHANRFFKYLPKWLYTILNFMDVYFVFSFRQLITKNNNLHKPELRALTRAACAFAALPSLGLHVSDYKYTILEHREVKLIALKAICLCNNELFSIST